MAPLTTEDAHLIKCIKLENPQSCKTVVCVCVHACVCVSGWKRIQMLGKWCKTLYHENEQNVLNDLIKTNKTGSTDWGSGSGCPHSHTELIQKDYQPVAGQHFTRHSGIENAHWMHSTLVPGAAFSKVHRKILGKLLILLLLLLLLLLHSFLLLRWTELIGLLVQCSTVALYSLDDIATCVSVAPKIRSS